MFSFNRMAGPLRQDTGPEGVAGAAPSSSFRSFEHPAPERTLPGDRYHPDTCLRDIFNIFHYGSGTCAAPYRQAFLRGEWQEISCRRRFSCCLAGGVDSMSFSGVSNSPGITGHTGRTDSVDTSGKSGKKNTGNDPDRLYVNRNGRKRSGAITVSVDHMAKKTETGTGKKIRDIFKNRTGKNSTGTARKTRGMPFRSPNAQQNLAATIEHHARQIDSQAVSTLLNRYRQIKDAGGQKPAILFDGKDGGKKTGAGDSIQITVTLFKNGKNLFGSKQDTKKDNARRILAEAYRKNTGKEAGKDWSSLQILEKLDTAFNKNETFNTVTRFANDPLKSRLDPLFTRMDRQMKRYPEGKLPDALETLEKARKKLDESFKKYSEAALKLTGPPETENGILHAPDTSALPGFRKATQELAKNLGIFLKAYRNAPVPAQQQAETAENAKPLPDLPDAAGVYGQYDILCTLPDIVAGNSPENVQNNTHTLCVEISRAMDMEDLFRPGFVSISFSDPDGMHEEYRNFLDLLEKESRKNSRHGRSVLPCLENRENIEKFNHMLDFF